MEKFIGAIFLAPFVPFVLYFASLIGYIFLAIPFYFLWNWAAPIYFTFLPPVWMVLPFWHIVWLMWTLGTIKIFIMPSVSSSSSSS